ncbi:YD repeat-containing protein [Actimicrobium sp. GrIS 1.19]|uniref:DUF6531 domain-containing protein n=1 Tax=Actimicrobium sp. GrIS 1.19 TaxID=3071708 RepID=UPI002E052D83|nr:YD repeat-containing protein [Actimicrobium sp. GrIS 1.19]
MSVRAILRTFVFFLFTLALTGPANAADGVVAPGQGTGGNVCKSNGAGNTEGSCSGAGNPINLITGNKYQREVDMPALPGVLGLEIVRHYNSIFAQPGVPNGLLGRGWRLSYEVDLYVVGDTIEILEADGHRLIFNRDPLNRSLCSTPDPANGSVAVQETAKGDIYVWTRGDGQTWRFNAARKLTQIRALTGESVNLQYDSDGLLVQVTDPQRRRLSLQTLDRQTARQRTRFSGVQSIISPVGRFNYEYGSSLPKGATLAPELVLANLVKVSPPNSTNARLYHYEDPQHPMLMTGISSTDAGKTYRLSTFGYQEDGRAILSTHANNVERVTLSYPERGTTILANSLGQTTVYRHGDIGGEYRIVEARGPGCRLCDSANVRYGYDKLGRTIDVTRLDANGTPIQSTRTTRDYVGRPLTVGTIAYSNGHPGPLLIQRRYEYGPGYTGSPTLIARPSVIPGKEAITRITYNEANQPLTVTESGWAPATDGPPTRIERTTTYRYAELHRKSVLTQIDGPLANGPSNSPADSDITRYQWDEGGNFIQRITYPMNRVASFEYDKNDINASSRLIKSTSPEGIVTELGYDGQGALVQMRRAGAQTVYRHDAAGRTNEVVDPTGQHLWFGYTPSGRIGWIADQQSNRIALEHDTEGQLMRSRLLNPDGSVSQQGAAYPHPDQTGSGGGRDVVLADVRRLIEAAQTSDSINLARPDTAGSAYAAVQAALTSVDADPDRPAQDSTSAAVNAHGAVTRYLTDDFGQLVQTQSPTTGKTAYRYNAAGQIMAKINQDGSRAHYTRDAAGRVITVQAFDARNTLDEDACIVWGAANKPVRVRYLAGEERFDYDAAGRLTGHTQDIDGKRLTLTYQYNSLGQLIAKTLPDGQTLRYRYRGSVHAKAGLLESIWLDGWNSPVGNKLTAGLFDRPVIEGMNAENERYAQRGFSFGNGLSSRADHSVKHHAA